MSAPDTADELTRTPPTLEDYLHLRAASGAYVTLMADAPGRRLYESAGFVETAPGSVGMRLAE